MTIVVKSGPGGVVVRTGENTAQARLSAAQAVTAADEARRSAANRVSLATATWAALAALTGTPNQSAAVWADAGTHVDPVVGGTVPNEGVYSYSLAPAGWRRIGNLADSALRSDLVATGGADLVRTSVGVSVETMLSGRKMRSVLEFMTAAQAADVLGDNPVLDVAPAFNAAIAWCAANKHALHIPKINAKLGSRITCPANVSVYSDPTAALTWTNTMSCGWVHDGAGLGGQAGFSQVSLPRLFGPNDTSGYFLAQPSYDLTAFAGKAFQLKDCIWCSVVLQYFLGWGVAFEMITTGAAPVDNHTVTLGTIDLCTTGISINSPSGTSTAVGQSVIYHRNIFAYTPINMTGLGAGTFQMLIIGTSVFCNQTGGACYYFRGTAHSNHTIKTGTAENHYAPDSPAGTPPSMRGRIIGGDGVVLSEAGWAIGTRLHIEASLPGTDYAAGDPMAFRLSGGGSRFVVNAPDVNTNTPAPLSTSQGEANYNGGVGGAATYRLTPVSVNCTGLAAGATRNFFFYHQRLNPSNYKPLLVSSAPGPFPAPDVLLTALNNNGSVPREAIVQVTNRTGAALTGTYNLLIGVD